MVSFESLGMVSYSPSTVTMPYLKPFLRYSPSKNGLTLKSGYGVTCSFKPDVRTYKVGEQFAADGAANSTQNID